VEAGADTDGISTGDQHQATPSAHDPDNAVRGLSAEREEGGMHVTYLRHSKVCKVIGDNGVVKLWIACFRTQGAEEIPADQQRFDPKHNNGATSLAPVRVEPSWASVRQVEGSVDGTDEWVRREWG